MLKIATALIVFLGGFAVMVLEVVGTRYLAKDFGDSFYVWISQIGVILIALALGYSIGGSLADRFRRTVFLAVPMAVAGLFIFFIPRLAPPLVKAITSRHHGTDVSALWDKLDPVMGSTVVFFLPCFVLAVISPYMVRVAARRLDRVGTTSGLIYAASTVGSIAGVFISGYIFIQYLSIPTIFQATGVVTLCLAALCLVMDKWLKAVEIGEAARQTEEATP